MHTNHRAGRFSTPALLALALALTACTTGHRGPNDASTATDSGTSLAARLDGRTFLLQSAEGFEAVADTTVRVSFDGTSFGFHAGCNHHGGDYALRDGVLVIENFASTEIGCDPERHAQDEWLATFFGAEPTLALDGDTLTFTGADATLAFLDREVADPDRPLVGTTWTVDTFIDGGAASNVPVDAPPTLRFEEDGTLSADTGCNQSGGRYEVDADTLTLSDVAFTEKACAGPAGTADTQVQSVIRDGTLTFTIEAARLTLMRGDVGLAATAP